MIFLSVVWQFRMIIIDIGVLVALSVVPEIEKGTLLLVIVYCVPGPLGTFFHYFILLINELRVPHGSSLIVGDFNLAKVDLVIQN